MLNSEWKNCPECGSRDTRHTDGLVFCTNEICPLFNDGIGAAHVPWRFKDGVEPFCNSEGSIESLFSGYLEPRDYLRNSPDLKKLQEAVDTIRSFDEALRAAGLVEEM